MVGGATLGSGPGFYKKGWSHKSELVSSTPLWPLYQFLPPGPCPALPSFNDEPCMMWKCKLNKSFLPKLLLVMVLHHSNSNPKPDIGTRIMSYCCDRPDHVVFGKIVEDFGKLG